MISEDKGTPFEHPLSRDGILAHRSSQADGRSALTSRVHGARRRLLDILEELRLCGTGITEEENIDVAADAVLAVDVL